MRALVSRGYSVTIFCSDSNHFANPPTFSKSYFMQEFEGVHWVWVRTIKYKSVRSMKRILSWIHFETGLLRLPFKRFQKPDVIVASSLSLLTVLSGIYLSRKYQARLIFEVRDIWPLTLTEEGGFSQRNPLVRLLAWVEKFGYSKADAIVGTMPNLEAHVRNVSKSQKPVYCIPMGYEESSLNKIQILPKEYLGACIPGGKFLIAYSGSLGTTNALETLFECAELLRDYESIHFVIVGSGDLLTGFKNRYGELPNITFLGKVPKKSVQAVLSNFDALYLSTLPSRVWDYGQSLNKLIDYMLSGKPVIASYSGFPSMLDEARSGIFVPSGDKESLYKEIIRISNLPPNELEEMGQRGRKWLLEQRSYQNLSGDLERILFPDKTKL